MQVGHLRKWERHLSGMTNGAFSISSSLMGRGGSSVLQSTVRRANVLGLRFGIPLYVGSRFRQGGDGVQGEARRALVRRRVGHLRVAPTALETGSQVLAGRSGGVGGRAVVHIKERRAAMHVWGEALQHRRPPLLDGGVMRRRRHGRVALRDGRVALRYRRVALVVDGRVALH